MPAGCASPAGSRRRWPSYRRSKLDNSTFSLMACPLRRVLVQKTQNVIDLAASAEAALSQTLPQQADDFAASEFDAFDQAHHHPHVGQHRRTRQTRFVEHHPFQPQFDRSAAIPRCKARWPAAALVRHPTARDPTAARSAGAACTDGGRCGVSSPVFRLPCGSTRCSAGWSIAGGGAVGNRTDNASSAGLRCGDA